jgi:hypothetical protein
LPPSDANVEANRGLSLYNGNIASIVSNNGFDRTSSNAANLLAQSYRYHYLNRFKGSYAQLGNNYTSDHATNNTWATNLSGTSVYQEIIKEDVTGTDKPKGYDANGNILGIKRTGSSLAYFDEMNYSYNLDNNGQFINNRLQNVKDVTTNADNGKFSDFSSNQVNDIYSYDAKGRLKSDASEEIESITWTPFDKVATITRKAGSNKPNLAFGYDGMGRRVSKTVTYPKNTDGSTNANDYTEYTVYDAGGKVLATYKVDNSNATATASLSETFVCGV